jgi:uncharacterized protein with FMN-binding domain
MQTVPGLVLCEKSEGTLIVFQQDAAGAQDIAHGGVIQIQLQQGADALQPVHQRIAVDEKLPGRGMEVLLLQAVQHGVDEGPEVGALGDGADKHVLIQGRGAAAARTAVQVPGGGGGFLYPVVKAPFYAAKVGVALLAVVGGLSVNTDLQVLDDEKKPIEGLYATGNTSGDLYAIDYPINMAGNSNGRCVIWGYLLGKTMAKATASGEALTSRDELADLAKDENGIVASDTVYKDGSYTGTGKGRGGDMEVTVTITDGKISDIVVNSHAESSDIGAPALDKLIQNAIAANSAEIDGASGATMTSDGFREAVAQALAKAQ